MDIGVPELLIVLFIIILLFGPGRIARLGGDLGKGLRSFRNGLEGKDDPGNKDADQAPPSDSANKPDDQPKT